MGNKDDEKIDAVTVDEKDRITEAEEFIGNEHAGPEDDADEGAEAEVVHSEDTAEDYEEKPRPVPQTIDSLSEMLQNVADGEVFFAAFLHNPRGDDARWYEANRKELVSGRLIRRNIPVVYWEEAATLRPPVARRDGDGFVLLE